MKAITSLSYWAGVVFICLLAPAVVCGAGDSPKTVQNEFVKITYDSQSQSFTLADKGTGNIFAADGFIVGAQGKGKVVPVKDPIFGQGQAIEITGSGEVQGSLMVFPKLPFALIRGVFTNPTIDPKSINKISLASMRIDIGRTAEELKTFGTGGLSTPDKNTGSYAWEVVVDPQTRRGVVGGWLTHDRASGVFFTPVEHNQVVLQAQAQYGRVRLEGGASVQTEILAIGFFQDARLGLETWADTIARVYSIHLPKQPTGYCTWYAEKHGGSSDEKSLRELADFAAANLKPYGFNLVQIDDGWQSGDSRTNGPNKNFTRHNPNGPYPSGMKATADHIRDLGLTAGIWFMPFAGTYNDPWFKDHQDWFVKHADGTPYDTVWGGTCIDMTHPGARQYLSNYVQRITRDWGYDYIKIDGLYTGTGNQQVYVNDAYREDGMGDAVFSDPHKSNIEAFRSGLKLVRQAADPATFILGCCVPQNMRSYGGAFGLVDAMRIGPDNSGSWKGWYGPSPIFGTRNYFLNGRVWYNDPDPGYARAGIGLEQVKLIFSWMAIAGGLNTSSDWMPGLTPERLEVLKRTMPSHGLFARPVDLFENEPAHMWLLTDNRQSAHPEARRDVVAMYNWKDEQAAVNVSLANIGLGTNDDYAAFDYWANAPLPVIKGRIQCSIPASSCRILAMRSVKDHPQIISTSRHVTQGMIDVTGETWTSRTRILSARSQVVGNDPYELRIVTAGKETSWKIKSVQIPAADKLAGVKTDFLLTSGLARITIRSPDSRTVAWKVQFTSDKETAK
jgi:hypothetical protein